MTRTVFFFLFLSVLLTGASACVAQSASGPIAFQPGSDLQKRSLSPSPAAGATKQSKQAAIGHGRAIIDTGDPKNSFWNEAVDLDGAGNVVNADMLWDASSKILYAFAHTNLRCTHTKSTEGDILIGIYGKKNFLEKRRARDGGSSTSRNTSVRRRRPACTDASSTRKAQPWPAATQNSIPALTTWLSSSPPDFDGLSSQAY